MIARSSNDDRLHAILFRDSGKIWPEPSAYLLREVRFAIFRTPDAMQKTTRERMHSRVIPVVPAGTRCSYIIEIPALKRWATITASPRLN